jgi:hypothetical protein
VATHRHRHHRRWLWVLLALVLVLGGLVAWFEFGSSRARPVSVQQAQSRLGPGHQEPTNGRPVPGVYSYTGAGMDRLSSPSLSQPEGPTVPGSVQLVGPACWTLRLDYSTHHWQTWRYCRDGTNLLQTGGQVWQLWPVGPVNFTNLTTTTCEAGAMALPGTFTQGHGWPSSCTGVSTEVKGTMRTQGVLTYLGPATVSVAGISLPAVHLLLTRTDTGAQTGSERYEMWLQPGTGLPLEIVQNISVTTDTPIGRSTYTQSGTLTLTSLQPAA